MMKAGGIILGIFMAVTCKLTAQPLIGLGKEEVRIIMNNEKKEFKIDKTVIRQEFNYLKYVNNNQTKTFIVFFNDDDICHKTKLVCDYSEYDVVRDELDENRQRVGAASWEYTHEGKAYLISLEEEEWYFVLRETEKEP
ncbi:MAG TPA: hypothetical protein ENN61_03065 [Bacteroidaceae bacterium]|nr:hypothetical protein [Bacteroidaceae bacterium]